LTVFLDTHVAVFLHAGDAALFSPAATHMLNASRVIRISPMVVLEMSYLSESRKIAYPGDQIAAFLHSQYDIAVDRDGTGPSVLAAASITWTRDPFDRIITAHAAHYGAFLLTRDGTIRDNYPAAIW
jgi:PIN domain nuclease of toxin-antitoxin system